MERISAREVSETELAEILEVARGLPGWNGAVCSFLMHMYPSTGLRASELRLAHIEDIDTQR